MPEAAVHEDNLLPRREHNVGTTRQIATMEPEAIPEPVQGAAQDEFRFCILLADPRHYVRTAVSSYVVGHQDERLGLGWQDRCVCPNSRGFRGISPAAFAFR